LKNKNKNRTGPTPLLLLRLGPLSGPLARPHACTQPSTAARSARARSLSLTSGPACHPFPLALPLTPARSLTSARWPPGHRGFGRPTDPTNTNYTFPRLRFTKLHHGSSSSDTSPTTVAARDDGTHYSDTTSEQQLKLKGRGASGAYHKHKTVIG
jgi:hypothetical protein